MHITNQITRILTYLGIPLGLLSILIVFITTSALSGNETLNLAITIDLLVTIPIVYFLLIRKSQIPKTTIVPVMVLGLIVGTYLLPPDQQTYLNIFKTWALPVIEVSVFILIIVKVRSAILRYKEHKSSTPDFYDTLKSVCYEMLPKRVALPFATEVAVFYYGFINWKKKDH